MRPPQAILSASAKVELFVALAVIALFLYAREDLGAWLQGILPPPTVQTSAQAGCQPPSEHEQLHVVLAWRDGRLVHLGCQYVGSQSAYVRGRR